MSFTPRPECRSVTVLAQWSNVDCTPLWVMLQHPAAGVLSQLGFTIFGTLSGWGAGGKLSQVLKSKNNMHM